MIYGFPGVQPWHNSTCRSLIYMPASCQQTRTAFSSSLPSTNGDLVPLQICLGYVMKADLIFSISCYADTSVTLA